MKIDLLHPSREQLLIKWPEVSKLRDISQWTTEAELAWLAEAASRGAKSLVEVGSYKGKSACAIALGMEQSDPTHKKLFCVDRFQDGTEADFRMNTVYYLNSGMIALIPKESEAGRDLLRFEGAKNEQEGQLLDFLFIDASHEKHDVLRDLQLWTPLVRDGGLIALHDCFPQDWPNNGIHQALLEFRPDFHLAIDSIACFYK